MKFQSVFLAIFVALGKLSKVSPVVEFTNAPNRFVRQIATPPPEAKWRLVFSPCAASCGGSYQRAKAVCMRGDYRVEEFECFDNKPSEAKQACGQQPCFKPYWSLIDYSDCPVTCGNGTIYIVAKCFINTAEKGPKPVSLEVSERMCGSTTRPPSSSRLCITPNCTVAIVKGGGDQGNVEAPTKNVCAERSAVETTILLGAATCLALLRIYIFNS